jgi:hypothetical protein
MSIKDDQRRMPPELAKITDQIHGGTFLVRMGEFQFTSDTVGVFTPRYKLHVDDITFNPSPILLIVESKIRETALTVEIFCKCVDLTGFDSDNNPTFGSPYFSHITQEIPAFTDFDTIYDLEVYNAVEIVSIVIDDGKKGDKIAVYGLGDSNIQILWGTNKDDVRDAIYDAFDQRFASFKKCHYSLGTGVDPDGNTCTTCNGSGNTPELSARRAGLDVLGDDAGIVRWDERVYESLDTELEKDTKDRLFRHRVHGQRMWIVPRAPDIKAVFAKFIDKEPGDIIIYENEGYTHDARIFDLERLYEYKGIVIPPSLYEFIDTELVYDALVDAFTFRVKRRPTEVFTNLDNWNVNFTPIFRSDWTDRTIFLYNDGAVLSRASAITLDFLNKIQFSIKTRYKTRVPNTTSDIIVRHDIGGADVSPRSYRSVSFRRAIPGNTTISDEGGNALGYSGGILFLHSATRQYNCGILGRYTALVTDGNAKFKTLNGAWGNVYNYNSDPIPDPSEVQNSVFSFEDPLIYGIDALSTASITGELSGPFSFVGAMNIDLTAASITDVQTIINGSEDAIQNINFSDRYTRTFVNVSHGLTVETIAGNAGGSGVRSDFNSFPKSTHPNAIYRFRYILNTFLSESGHLIDMTWAVNYTGRADNSTKLVRWDVDSTVNNMYVWAIVFPVGSISLNGGRIFASATYTDKDGNTVTIAERELTDGTDSIFIEDFVYDNLLLYLRFSSQASDGSDVYVGNPTINIDLTYIDGINNHEYFAENIIDGLNGTGSLRFELDCETDIDFEADADGYRSGVEIDDIVYDGFINIGTVRTRTFEMDESVTDINWIEWIEDLKSDPNTNIMVYYRVGQSQFEAENTAWVGPFTSSPTEIHSGEGFRFIQWRIVLFPSRINTPQVYNILFNVESLKETTAVLANFERVPYAPIWTISIPTTFGSNAWWTYNTNAREMIELAESIVPAGTTVRVEHYLPAPGSALNYDTVEIINITDALELFDENVYTFEDDIVGADPADWTFVSAGTGAREVSNAQAFNGNQSLRMYNGGGFGSTGSGVVADQENFGSWSLDVYVKKIPVTGVAGTGLQFGALDSHTFLGDPGDIISALLELRVNAIGTHYIRWQDGAVWIDDFGAVWSDNTWYRVQVRGNTVTQLYWVRVEDAATGEVLVEQDNIAYYQTSTKVKGIYMTSYGYAADEAFFDDARITHLDP